MTIRTLLAFSIILILSRPAFCADIKDNAVEEYRLKGFQAQQEGKLDEALSNYVKAASLSSNPAAIYNDMGVIYEKLGLVDRAQESYLEALRQDDEYLPAYANLAYFYEAQGKTQKAITYLKKRVEQGDQDDPWTQNAKARLERLSSRSPKVRDWLKNEEVREFNRQLENEARKEFSEDVSQAKSFFQKAERLSKDKKYEQAIEEYNRALSFTPQNQKILSARNKAISKWMQEKARFHAENGLRLLKMGDTISAQVEFRKILAIIPNEPIQISE